MTKEEVQKTIITLEKIRDILGNVGIKSETQDECFQKICNQIDALYLELLKG